MPKKSSKPVRPVKAASSRKPVAKPAKASKPAAAKPAARIAVAAKTAPRKPTARKRERNLRLEVSAPPPEPMDSGLNKQDIAGFREMLLAKRSQLVGDMSTMRDEALRSKGGGDLSSMPIHMADLGTDNFEQEFTLGLIEGEQQVVREIDAALERIDRGSYGLCLATGKPIGKARLKAQPWARYCYDYMLAQERGQTRRRY